MLAVPGQKLSLLGFELNQQLAKTLQQINLKTLQGICGLVCQDQTIITFLFMVSLHVLGSNFTGTLPSSK